EVPQSLLHLLDTRPLFAFPVLPLVSVAFNRDLIFTQPADLLVVVLVRLQRSAELVFHLIELILVFFRLCYRLGACFFGIQIALQGAGGLRLDVALVDVAFIQRAIGLGELAGLAAAGLGAGGFRRQ